MALLQTTPLLGGPAYLQHPGAWTLPPPIQVSLPTAFKTAEAMAATLSLRGALERQELERSTPALEWGRFQDHGRQWQFQPRKPEQQQNQHQRPRRVSNSTPRRLESASQKYEHFAQDRAPLELPRPVRLQKSGDDAWERPQREKSQPMRVKVSIDDLGETTWACAKFKLESAGLGRRGKPLIIFDWDDTILPTSVLVPQERRLGMPPRPADLESALAACCAAGARALRAAKQLGRVVIITNALEGWVERSAATYLPEVAVELDGVAVVSARSIFEPKGIENPGMWKTKTFERVARCFQVQDWLRATSPLKKVPMVSIGDSPWERTAAHEVARDKGLHFNATTVKFREVPSIEELTMELNLCADSLRHVLPPDDIESMDLHISDACQLEPGQGLGDIAWPFV